MYFCQMITITLIRTHLRPDSKFRNSSSPNSSKGEGESLIAMEAAFLTHLCTLCILYHVQNTAHKSQGTVT